MSKKQSTKSVGAAGEPTDDYSFTEEVAEALANHFKGAEVVNCLSEDDEHEPAFPGLLLEKAPKTLAEVEWKLQKAAKDIGASVAPCREESRTRKYLFHYEHYKGFNRQAIVTLVGSPAEPGIHVQAFR